MYMTVLCWTRPSLPLWFCRIPWYTQPGNFESGYSQGIVVQGVSGYGGGEGSTAFTRFAMTVAAFSVFAGVWYWMKDTDKSVLMGDEDPAMKTDAYLRTVQAAADMKRAMASYNEDVVEEDMDDDPAMRARFEGWMKEYGRTYKDEEEKARRFKIFKAFARSVDANNAEAAESGSTVRYGLTQLADWNTQEIRSACCSETNRGKTGSRRRVAKLYCEGISSENQPE